MIEHFVELERDKLGKFVELELDELKHLGSAEN